MMSGHNPRADRPAAQLGKIALLNRREERVHVDVQDRARPVTGLPGHGIEPGKKNIRQDSQDQRQDEQDLFPSGSRSCKSWKILLIL